jgi:hypothetical protein
MGIFVVSGVIGVEVHRKDLTSITYTRKKLVSQELSKADMKIVFMI